MRAARRDYHARLHAALTDPAAPPLPSPPTGTARGDYSIAEILDRIAARTP